MIVYNESDQKNKSNSLNAFILSNMQKYKTLQTLGDGAFGSVYKATNTKTGEIVAIKKMKQKYHSWDECVELREIKSLRKLDSPNVIKLKEVLLVSDELYMVFEYLEYNLYEVYAKMKEKGSSFTETEIKSMIYQILSGLAHMHKNGFFHRDMKPENILLYNNVVKVCDLGLAREIRSRPPFTDYVSTRWYRAPELLLRCTNYNSPVDIFALGCIMAQLYTLSPLFPGENEIDQLNKITKVLGTPSKAQWPEGYKLAQKTGYYFPEQKGVNLADLIPKASPEAIDLMESMLKYSSRKRPTAAELLKHSYFNGVRLPETIPQSEEVLFKENPLGKKLDTSKEDKKIDEFRATKEKFRMTRKHDARESNPFKVIENNSKVNKHSEMEDLDSLIKELEEKGKKKKSQTEKLPHLALASQNPSQLRESKTQIRKLLKPKPTPREEFKTDRRQQPKKYEPSFKTSTQSSYMKEPELKKFSYSFQPASLSSSPAFNPVFNPAYMSKGKSVSKLSSLPKLWAGSNPIYKY